MGDSDPHATIEEGRIQGTPTYVSDMPSELIRQMLAGVDAETLALSVPLVCKSWRDASRQRAVWQGLLPPRLLAQLNDLALLGPAVSPGHLYLALFGRNLLRNPEFRRDANSSLLPPLQLLGSPGPSGLGQWMKTQRTAWVINSAVGSREVAWERPPQGMAPAGCPTGPPPAPPAPLPYPGGSFHLVSYMQRALRGLFGIVRQAAGSAAEFSAKYGAGSTAEGSVDQQSAAQTAGAQQAHGSEGGEEPQEEQGQEEQGQEEQGQEEQQQGQQLEGTVGTTCLASLENWSEVTQVVDLHWELQRRGLTAAQAAHLLDAELGLRFSVHVGSRHDSEGEYAVALLLDEGCRPRPRSGLGRFGGRVSLSAAAAAGVAAADGPAGGAQAMPSLQSFVMRRSRHLGFREVEHMTCGEWERFEYAVQACPRGFRRAVVMLRGRRAPGGGGGGRGAGAREGGVGEGGRRGQEEEQVAPATRYCGAKFASANLVFV